MYNLKKDKTLKHIAYLKKVRKASKKLEKKD